MQHALLRFIERWYNFIERWYLEKSLRVNPNNSEIMIFTRKRKFAFQAPSICNTVLSFNEVHYFDVILDHKLYWNKTQ